MDSRYVVHTTTGIHREARYTKVWSVVTSYCDLALSALSTTIGGALWERANFSRFLREPWSLCGIDDVVAFSSSKLCLYVWTTRWSTLHFIPKGYNYSYMYAALIKLIYLSAYFEVYEFNVLNSEIAKNMKLGWIEGSKIINLAGWPDQQWTTMVPWYARRGSRWRGRGGSGGEGMSQWFLSCHLLDHCLYTNNKTLKQENNNFRCYAHNIISTCTKCMGE